MVEVASRYCIDAYEAAVVEIDEAGGERPHPHFLPVTGLRVRAVSGPGVFPQGYISRNEAAAACAAADKRLCSETEWELACASGSKFPYGDSYQAGACNDQAAVSPMNRYHGGPNTAASAYTWDAMNDPRLNQLAGGLARTGEHATCKSPAGTFDMVGNLHEWIDDAGGTFRGGFYLDARLHGDGCSYVTTAHDANYHDYSTGFRCCKDAP
jgi:formylglycine-generating enzyme